MKIKLKNENNLSKNNKSNNFKNISKDQNFLNIIYSSLIIFLLITIDQISKYLFFNKQYLFNKFIFIKYSQNTGSSFSLFSNLKYYNYIIIIFSIIIILGLFYFKQNFFNLNKNNKFKQNKKINIYLIVWILFISGISGNLIDRIILGYVQDFIGISNFFICNMADIYLNFGIILILFDEFKKYPLTKRLKNKY